MKNSKNNRIVYIDAGGVNLEGELAIPVGAKGVVIFAHGSGSSRHSYRNKFVAKKLQKEGIGTLLFDLLTEKEDEIYETRFNIGLLTERLVAATKWLEKQPEITGIKIGYFGASTGAAAALESAAVLGNKIKAVVSRGGRPDLALDSLPEVKSPTLLIVGGEDNVVIELNEKAFKEIRASKKLEIIPNSTHLFEEPGAIEEVSLLASNWFRNLF